MKAPQSRAARVALGAALWMGITVAAWKLAQLTHWLSLQQVLELAY